MGNKFYIILKTEYKRIRDGYTIEGCLTPVKNTPVSICCDGGFAYQRVSDLNYKTDDETIQYSVVEKDELPIVDGQVVIKI